MFYGTNHKGKTLERGTRLGQGNVSKIWEEYMCRMETLRNSRRSQNMGSRVGPIHSYDDEEKTD